MITRLVAAFHVLMFLSTFCFLCGGAVGMVISAEEKNWRQFKVMFIWMVTVALYWGVWFVYWLITGDGLIGA